MDEKWHDLFVARLQKVFIPLRTIENLANPTYTFTQEEVDTYFDKLQRRVDETRQLFNDRLKRVEKRRASSGEGGGSEPLTPAQETAAEGRPRLPKTGSGIKPPPVPRAAPEAQVKAGKGGKGGTPTPAAKAAPAASAADPDGIRRENTDEDLEAVPEFIRRGWSPALGSDAV